MIKPRPPQQPDISEVDKIAKALAFMPNLKIRQVLRSGHNNYPFFLYKYLSSNCPIEHLRCLLIDSDFYLSRCTDFNDPFDTTAQIIHENNLTQRRKRFTDIAKKQMPNASKGELAAQVSKMMVKFANEPKRIDGIFEINTQNAGIFSLTENPRNILMWSHYATDHKGLVLQFDISKDPESLLFALPMHYSKEYPEYNVNDPNFNFETIMLRKAKDWEYEKEWRLLRISGANTFQPFKHRALTGLIFGCRATEEYKKQVKEILSERLTLKHPPVKTYRAVKHKSKYALQIYKDS